MLMASRSYACVCVCVCVVCGVCVCVCGVVWCVCVGGCVNAYGFDLLHFVYEV